jgi:hypothetical protein
MTDKKPDDKHDEKKPVAAPADLKPAAPDGESEMERMRRTDPMFIEKTKPEDPSGRPGQLTRDNVNPHIPSGKPGDPPGPIVDPNTLGMPQGGVAPASPMKPENPTGAPHEKDRYDDLNVDKAKPKERK